MENVRIEIEKILDEYEIPYYPFVREIKLSDITFSNITENNAGLIDDISFEYLKPSGRNVVIQGISNSGKKKFVEDVLYKIKSENPHKQIIIFDYKIDLDNDGGNVGLNFFRVANDVLRNSLNIVFINENGNIKKIDMRAGDNTIFYVPNIESYFNSIATIKFIYEIMNFFYKNKIRFIGTFNLIDFKKGLNSTLISNQKIFDINNINIINKLEQDFIINSIKSGVIPISSEKIKNLFKGVMVKDVQPINVVDVALIIYRNSKKLFGKIKVSEIKDLFNKILLLTYLSEKGSYRNNVYKNALMVVEGYLFDTYYKKDISKISDDSLLNCLLYFFNKSFTDVLDFPVSNDIKSDLALKIKKSEFSIDFVKKEDISWEIDYSHFVKFLSDFNYKSEIEHWNEPINFYKSLIQSQGGPFLKITDLLIQLITNIHPETDIKKFSYETLVGLGGEIKGVINKKQENPQLNPIGDFLGKILSSNSDVSIIGDSYDLKNILLKMTQVKNKNNNGEKTSVKNLEFDKKIDLKTKKEIIKTRIKEINEKLNRINYYLKNEIIGQDNQRREIINTLKNGYLNVSDRKRPISSFLFLGPTGVGKTQTAKVIAKALLDKNSQKKNFLHINMSELMEDKTSVTRLIGAAPGYVGYGEGVLVDFFVKDKVKEGVILFDEIEKAHPQILDIFLQILDEGQLTISGKYNIDFSNFIIVFTSNLGVKDLISRSDLGIKANKEEDIPVSNEVLNDTVLQSLKDTLKPELINRIDSKIVYSFITRDVAGKIFDKTVDKLNKELHDQFVVKISVNNKLKSYILDKGYDAKFGVRNLQSSINQYINSKIMSFLISNPDSIGSNLTLSLSKNRVLIKKGKGIKK